MFFQDPPAAFANIARALHPAGRLVMRDLRGQRWAMPPMPGLVKCNGVP